MKYLLIMGIVIGIIWWFKLDRKISSHQPPPSQSPDPMVRCGYCGLHLPHDEALHTPKGIYCSKEHQDLQERGAS